MASAMARFPDGMHVWLRSVVRRGYLHADDDGVGVSLRRRRASVNAAWEVQHHVHEGETYVLLRSCAYGRYLALSAFPQPPSGHRGRRALQSDFDAANVHPIMWTAQHAVGTAGRVLVRHASGRYLRANGMFRFWHNGVTADFDAGYRTTMMHWTVVEIPPRQEPPAIPTPTWYPVPDRRRTIRYAWMGAASAFSFYGRSVFNLRVALILRVNEPNITLYVGAGEGARLTPLVVDLPRSVERLDLVVVPTASPAVAATRHPDVDADVAIP